MPRLGVGELLVLRPAEMVERWWLSRDSAGAREHVFRVSPIAPCDLGKEIEFRQERCRTLFTSATKTYEMVAVVCGVFPWASSEWRRHTTSGFVLKE